ncbi:MAG: DUF3090 domain-containing protein [Anaerolineae bacterium]
MTSYAFDLKPCSRLTVGAIGPAGQRTFYLQGIQNRQVISLLIEKQHAQALAVGIDELLAEINEQYPPNRAPEAPPRDLSLVDPVTPLFRLGRLGLGYEAEDDLLVIFAQELTDEEDATAGEPLVGRFWASREQMTALSAHIKKLASAGRPICALCGNPIDPEGHFCPPSNGHARTTLLQ